MSGRRTKALRRKFIEQNGRAPMGTRWANAIRMQHGEHKRKVTQNSGLRRFFQGAVTSRIKRVVGWFAAEHKQSSFVATGNEFRAFKRGTPTAVEVYLAQSERKARQKRRAAEVEANNERIKVGVIRSRESRMGAAA